MSKVLVSLVSEQTIPSVEFIREMQHEVDLYLFITTRSMESSGNREWILNTVALESSQLLEPVVVDAFSFEDIEQKISRAVNDEDIYFVNLTGGTKVMSLAVYEFFKTLNSEMYYLTGNSEKIKIHPGRRKIISKLKVQISLSDYLSAYGFKIKSQSTPLYPKEMAEKILKYFLHNFDKDNDIPVLEKLRMEGRSKGVKDVHTNQALTGFLNRVGFALGKDPHLSQSDCQYLSGEWLEEYLIWFLKFHFDFPDSAIGMNLKVEKSTIPNQFDVLVMRKNRIELYECKTSIYLDSDESQTFIGETVYKSDSLRNKLGLFAQTTVVTLSDLSKPKLKPHLDRADASRVKLIGREAFLSGNLVAFLK